MADAAAFMYMLEVFWDVLSNVPHWEEVLKLVKLNGYEGHMYR